MATASSHWYVAIQDGPAPWLDPSWLEEQRQSLPAHVYRRLFECVWTEGDGAFLSAEEVERVFTEDVPQAIGPAAVGVDVGLSRDACVASVVRRDQASGLVVIEALETWQGRRGAKVDLVDVREDVLALARRAGGPVIVDPWQAALLAQDLRAAGVMVQEHQATAEGRRRVFTALLDLIRAGRLRARPHQPLRQELLGLEVQERASGWRVDHHGGGHDDHTVAVALAAHHLVGRQVCEGARVIMGPRRVALDEFPLAAVGPGPWVRMSSPWD